MEVAGAWRVWCGWAFGVCWGFGFWVGFGLGVWRVFCCGGAGGLAGGGVLEEFLLEDEGELVGFFHEVFEDIAVVEDAVDFPFGEGEFRVRWGWGGDVHEGGELSVPGGFRNG